MIFDEFFVQAVGEVRIEGVVFIGYYMGDEQWVYIGFVGLDGIQYSLRDVGFFQVEYLGVEEYFGSQSLYGGQFYRGVIRELIGVGFI